MTEQVKEVFNKEHFQLKANRDHQKIAIFSHFGTHMASFKVLYQNFQSLYNKQHLLESFITQNPTYQAFCITESWLNQAKLELMNFAGYKIAASYCRKTRCGGGVCILLQDHLECIKKT